MLTELLVSCIGMDTPVLAFSFGSKMTFFISGEAALTKCFYGDTANLTFG